MLLEREYEKIFDKIDDCFRLLKRRLFVDQWLQESTKLVFTLVNETEDMGQMYLFEKIGQNEYFMESCDLSAYDSYDLAIDGWVHQQEYVEKNTKRELKLSELWGCKISIWCVCLSTCLDKNKGKFLLEQAFQTMVESLRDWCMDLEALNCQCKDKTLRIPLDNDNWHDFVQGILQKTYEKVKKQLECFYSPVKIPYIISLSGEYYEKAENDSNLLFLPQIKADDIDALQLKYDFRKNSQQSNILFVPENIRRIRKLTQIARGNLYLVLQIQPKEEEYEVLGICKKDSIESLVRNGVKKIPYFICKAKGHMQWDLFLGKEYIFSFMNGDYRITLEMPIEYLESRCKNLFPIEEVDLKKVYENVCECQKQSHGTMLVMLSERDAEAETLRFSKRNFGMSNAEPRVQADALDKLDSIDGSIITDIKGRIHSIGVILDGDSNIEGAPERGARYNSALRYCGYLKNEGISGLVLIISEDSSVDMIDTDAITFFVDSECIV